MWNAFTGCLGGDDFSSLFLSGRKEKPKIPWKRGGVEV
ncbi:hypothetical protein ADU37_CDS06990 [Thermococcus sp. 2319x1]|nr:hypothetical protein ADU37_CDS06990 [Thermococcus sp. 2319x1]